MENSMANFTYAREFFIVPFSTKPEDGPLIVSVFVMIYLFGVLANSVIITVIHIDDHLNTPMYFFLSNLSVVDICYTTVVVPKLLDMLISGKNKVAINQCYTQMFAFYWTGSTEDLLLFTMAYDRYVAVCKPLHYHLILSRPICILLIVAIWLAGCLNALFILMSFSSMSFCHSNTIQHIFCDFKALIRISCSNMNLFYKTMYVELFLFGICPFVCTFVSYMKIIKVILGIKSTDGRRKAFSTCSSHLTVLLIYYVTIAVVILVPSSDYSNLLEQAFTMLYATVAPMINPLIYTLRNTDVKKALMRIGIKIKHPIKGLVKK